MPVYCYKTVSLGVVVLCAVWKLAFMCVVSSQSVHKLIGSAESSALLVVNDV
jgi:hypothetical protein